MSNDPSSTANIFPLTGAIRTPIAQQVTDAFSIPVTLQGAADPQRSRTSFIGRDVDKESDLGAFGARLYPSEYGRFVAVDKLWEEYGASSTYSYGVNCPTVLADKSGLSITAGTPEAQTLLTSSLPSSVAKHVTFKENGSVDLDNLQNGLKVMKKDKRTNKNDKKIMELLINIAKSEHKVQVLVVGKGDLIPYIDLPRQNPNAHSSLDVVDAEGWTVPSQTAAESMDKTFCTTDGSIHMYVGRTVEGLTQEQVAAHELFCQVGPIIDFLDGRTTDKNRGNHKKDRGGYEVDVFMLNRHNLVIPRVGK
jgi:RHS repeat-associated protein